MDYGSGAGFLSREIAKRGGEVVAVEPYGEACDLGYRDQILRVRSLDEIQDNIKFGWIFLVEVLEHMLDPVGVLSRLHDFLLPEGKLVVTTPNARGWRGRKEGFLWREAQNPTHITLFSDVSLDICIKSAGFVGVRRLLRPVDYGKKGLGRVALAITQLAGIDGGLRFIAEK